MSVRNIMKNAMKEKDVPIIDYRIFHDEDSYKSKL
jgi:hypothetical protein